MGIEYDAHIYQGAMENRKTAIAKAKADFVQANAESYEVPPEALG